MEVNLPRRAQRRKRQAKQSEKHEARGTDARGKGPNLDSKQDTISTQTRGLCHYFSKNNYCRFGSNCRLSHDCDVNSRNSGSSPEKTAVIKSHEAAPFLVNSETTPAATSDAQTVRPVRAVGSVSSEPAAVAARLVAVLDNYQADQEEQPDSKVVTSSPLSTTHFSVLGRKRGIAELSRSPLAVSRVDDHVGFVLATEVEREPNPYDGMADFEESSLADELSSIPVPSGSSNNDVGPQ